MAYTSLDTPLPRKAFAGTNRQNLQGLKDRLAETEGEEADELREEIEELETRIGGLTEFRSGRPFHESSAGG